MQPDHDSMGAPRHPRPSDPDAGPLTPGKRFARRTQRGRRKSDLDIARLAYEVHRARIETRTLAAVVALVIVGFGMFTWLLVANLRREGEQRRDQTCTILETKQRADVDALARTYRYLAGLTTEQLKDPLNRAVLANLPNVVRQAQIDDAPPYCDEPGVGLPEPDPVIPKRPPGLP